MNFAFGPKTKLLLLALLIASAYLVNRNTQEKFGIQAYELVDSGAKKSAAGDTEGAMADFNRAIELKPGLAVAYANRGGLKGKLGDYEGALADLDVSISLSPTDIAYFNRGLAKYALGDREGALRDFKAAQAMNPAVRIPDFGN